MKEIENPGTNKETYFFDTYALFEIIGGNLNYQKYSDCNIVTTIFNLAEFNYNLKKDMPKKKADDYTEDYYDFMVEVELEDVKKAMDLKSAMRELSIPDAIGYIVAQRLGVKFLTGDSDFADMKNVEFVKK
ncbi:MAG: PIN domain-containing protein [Nanoarchaeota archaeon]